LNLVIDENGELVTPITLAENPSVSNVSIANARFEGGTVRLTDRRSGESWRADDCAGVMQLTAVRGPFALEGRASHDGTAYGVRIGTSAMSAAGAMQVSGFVRPADGGFWVAVEGLLRTGGSPTLEGALTYRQAMASEDDAVVGAMVLQSPDRKSTRLNSSHVKSSYAV